MFNLPDLRPFVYLALFGLLCAVLMIVIGVPAAIWWLFHHVSIH
jgi:hypothetical protein